MGTVHALGRRQPEPLGDAIAAYLTSLAGPEKAGTRKTFSVPLRAMAAEFGPDLDVAALDGQRLAAWFTARWEPRAANTWNVALVAIRLACVYWRDQGWMAADPTTLLRRRDLPPDRSRAVSRAEVESLLTREDIPLRDKTLWRMLYETAARSAEVLRLDVQDLDLPNRRAKVVRKGGAVDIVVWQTGTARLLPRLLKGRKTGPLFLTDRRARVELPPGDIDPGSGRARLSYRQAEAIFAAVSGGKTLHQLRHSALTLAAENGASTSMLMAYSGHTSVASVIPYSRPSPEALGRWQAERDPARRR
jgi:integrase